MAALSHQYYRMIEEENIMTESGIYVGKNQVQALVPISLGSTVSTALLSTATPPTTLPFTTLILYYAVFGLFQKILNNAVLYCKSSIYAYFYY